MFESESDKKVSTPVAVVVAGALALALGCSAGVKATTATGTAGSTGTDAGVDRPITVGTAGVTGGGGSTPNIVGTGRHDGRWRHGRRVHADVHLRSGRRPLLQHDRQRLQGTAAGLRRVPRRRDVQRRRDVARRLHRRAELPGDHLQLRRRREVLRQGRRRLRPRAGLRHVRGRPDLQRRPLRARQLHAADLRDRRRRPVLRQDRRRLRRHARLPGVQRAPAVRRLRDGRVRHAALELYEPPQLKADGRAVLRRRRRQLREHDRLRHLRQRHGVPDGSRLSVDRSGAVQRPAVPARQGR